MSRDFLRLEIIKRKTETAGFLSPEVGVVFNGAHLPSFLDEVLRKQVCLYVGFVNSVIVEVKLGAQEVSLKFALVVATV